MRTTGRRKKRTENKKEREKLEKEKRERWRKVPMIRSKDVRLALKGYY